MTRLEISANVFNLLSVWFSSRNSVHTWWSGIIGCALYGVLFVEVKLYADVTLQLFFVASCAIGWWNWQRGGGRAPDVGAQQPAIESASSLVAPAELPITQVTPWTAIGLTVVAIACAAAYGALLQAWTPAANPFVDSMVLALSILAQLLMVARKIETWPVWFVVDCIAVPLYASKGLWLTATAYAFFLILVLTGWLRWSRLIVRDRVAEPAMTVVR
ncbi:MAG: nicotinamide riboside transporter PnuC [Burkholderiaceae bacterium]